MKKELLFIIIWLLIGSMMLFGQENNSYKPLTNFRKDTTAFLSYNFKERNNAYKGKMIDDLINDIPFSIQEIVLSIHPFTESMDGFSIKYNTKDQPQRVLYIDCEDTYNAKEYNVWETKNRNIEETIDYLRTIPIKIRDVTLLIPEIEEKYDPSIKPLIEISGSKNLIYKTDTMIITRYNEYRKRDLIKEHGRINKDTLKILLKKESIYH